MNCYDTLDEFSGELAAKLIAGANDTTANQDQYQVVLRSLHTAYQTALDYYTLVCEKGWSPRPPLLGGPAWSQLPPLSAGAIQSEKMLTCERTLEYEPRGGSFDGWLTYRPTVFESQSFERAELIRWLDAVGLKSDYPFDPVPAADPAQNTATPLPVVAASDDPATLPAGQQETKWVDKGPIYKKKALIERLLPNWPNIVNDFQHGQDNNLVAAARVPGQHGEYFEKSAINWAIKKGKWTERETPAKALNLMMNVPGKQYTKE